MSQEDSFRNQISKDIERQIDAKGDVSYIDSADGDFATQLAQVQQFVDAGADAIVIFAVGTPEQNRQLFRYAKQVPLIFINTEPVEDLSSMPANTVYVGSNEQQSGTLQMEELARLAHHQGKVALLIGDENHPAARARTQDVKQVLAKYPNMSLVASKTANWQRNQAYKVVSQWLQQQLPFDVLVANNDEMILGGLMALRDAGKNPADYLTGGIDATVDALKELQAGNLDVTILQDAAGQASAVVDATYKLLQQQAVHSPSWVPFRLVTSNNVQTFLNN
ncbi:substrate-binding domain-containing protein [Shewanella mangrovi]|nr:substrate-binding domain-containing protein [Shewanella mangrovi]